jgi:hypothetical protein
VVNATRERKGRAGALGLARSAKRVVVGRGHKVVTFDMQKDPPDDDTPAAQLLGPTGSLKAPALRIGDTLLVGFAEEAYWRVLGG